VQRSEEGKGKGISSLGNALKRSPASKTKSDATSIKCPFTGRGGSGLPKSEEGAI